MILHIDMDAFYAAVEQADNPDLKGRCVVVGGASSRSVVSAASYEARQFGVKSAMPMFMALKKCPHAVILPVRMDRYKYISGQIMQLLEGFSPVVEQLSIDEAFLDVSGFDRVHHSPEQMAGKIKQAIYSAFDLTCSIGAAPNKFLAKVASEYRKPDGLTVILPDEVEAFINALPIEKVPGIGVKTYEALTEIGIYTLGDVKKYPAAFLVDRLGKFGRRLIDLAAGIDRSPVCPHGPAKSVGSEETFSSDIADKNVLKTILLKQSEDVGRQLRIKKLKAKTVTLKIKHSDFTQITRSITLDEPVQSAQFLRAAAAKLLDDYPLKKRVRLIGVSASALLPDNLPVQKKLFQKEAGRKENWDKVDTVVDAIARKYGKPMVHKAGIKP
jgi:DNA polymerase IV